jgi:Putative Ig domain
MQARALCGAMALSVATLVGCGGVVEEMLWEAVWDCIDYDGPEFVTAALPSGTVGQAYTAVITAEIVREPYDDDFHYSFELRGQLPPGLEFRDPKGGRHIELVGTPTTAGNYSFTLSVSIPMYDAATGAGTGLCWYEAAKTYEIWIASPPLALAKGASHPARRLSPDLAQWPDT